MNYKFMAALLAVSTLLGCATSSETKADTSETLSDKLEEVANPKTETAEVDVTEDEGTPIPVEPAKIYAITCPECNTQEKMALKAFQDQGVTDKLALAALMGNIQQESRFIANICEGGARVPYERCHRGGYGLIQWTTTGRYDGLGRFARNNECNPSTTECQLGYLFTEREWKKAAPYMKTEGRTIEWYMKYAYWWLGWGIHGLRTDYAYNYSRMFSPMNIINELPSEVSKET